MTKINRRRWTTAALVSAVICGWWAPITIGANRAGQAAAQADATARPVFGAAAAVAATDRGIRQFEKRVAETPLDYLSYTILGQLHARRARETGDLDSYTRAEGAFRAALDANKDHLAAMLGLAAAYASQHKFAEALQMARKIQAANPDSVDALAVLGDALVEIGEYKDAENAFGELQLKVPDEPSVIARIAHLAELKGKHEYSLQLLRQAAAKELDEEGNGETTAWYQTRIGSLLYRAGKLDEASKSFEAALEMFDGYYIALDGLAEVRVAQHRDPEAILLLERAVAGVPQPASLVDLGDLYMKAGRAADAERVFSQAESIAERPGSYQSAYRRELAMFYANHDRNPEKALALARQDLDSRPDIYGYDALAWTLYKNNRFDEAAEAMGKALALGTQEATLFAHAGLIDTAAAAGPRPSSTLSSASNLCSYLVKDDARSALADLSAAQRAR